MGINLVRKVRPTTSDGRTVYETQDNSREGRYCRLVFSKFRRARRQWQSCEQDGINHHSLVSSVEKVRRIPLHQAKVYKRPRHWSNTSSCRALVHGANARTTNCNPSCLRHYGLRANDVRAGQGCVPSRGAYMASEL